MSLNVVGLAHQVDDGDHSRALFTDLNLSLLAGESIALMGDSGSGKTTLLNLIAGLTAIQAGEIYIEQQPLSQCSDKVLSEVRKQYLAIVFQQFNLLANLSVKDNIAFSAKLANRFCQQRVDSLVGELGLASLLDKLPNMLSGGEMQRVAIARALAGQPKLLLADEPTGNLDSKNSERVMQQLVMLTKAHHTGLIVVTHSVDVAKYMDKTYRLHNGCLQLEFA